MSWVGGGKGGNGAAGAYTPGDPTDWATDPTTIQEALDFLASGDHYFEPADAAALAAIVAEPGDIAVQQDTLDVYNYDGASDAWKLIGNLGAKKFVAVATASQYTVQPGDDVILKDGGGLTTNEIILPATSGEIDGRCVYIKNVSRTEETFVFRDAADTIDGIPSPQWITLLPREGVLLMVDKATSTWRILSHERGDGRRLQFRRHTANIPADQDTHPHFDEFVNMSPSLPTIYRLRGAGVIENVENRHLKIKAGSPTPTSVVPDGFLVPETSDTIDGQPRGIPLLQGQAVTLVADDSFSNWETTFSRGYIPRYRLREILSSPLGGSTFEVEEFDEVVFFDTQENFNFLELPFAGSPFGLLNIYTNAYRIVYVKNVGPNQLFVTAQNSFGVSGAPLDGGDDYVYVAPNSTYMFYSDGVEWRVLTDRIKSNQTTFPVGATHTATAQDDVIVMTTASWTVTLPGLFDFDFDEFQITVKDGNVGGGTVQITGGSGDLIDGAVASIAIGNRSSLTFLADLANNTWWIL